MDQAKKKSSDQKTEADMPRTKRYALRRVFGAYILKQSEIYMPPRRQKNRRGPPCPKFRADSGMGTGGAMAQRTKDLAIDMEPQVVIVHPKNSNEQQHMTDQQAFATAKASQLALNEGGNPKDHDQLAKIEGEKKTS